jgi:hypothetical protein
MTLARLLAGAADIIRMLGVFRGNALFWLYSAAQALRASRARRIDDLTIER